MDNDFGSDFITITDEEGNEFELEHLDTLEMNGETYMAFTPVLAEDQGEPEEIEVVILKVAIEDDEEIFITVDDEDELDQVYEVFMDRIENDEDTILS